MLTRAGNISGRRHKKPELLSLPLGLGLEDGGGGNLLLPQNSFTLPEFFCFFFLARSMYYCFG